MTRHARKLEVGTLVKGRKLRYLVSLLLIVGLGLTGCSDDGGGANGGGADAGEADAGGADAGGDTNPAAECGDGICNGDETTDDCPADCDSQSCTAECSSSGAVLFCDAMGQQDSYECPTGSGCEMGPGGPECGCGTIPAGGVCQNYELADAELIACEGGELVYYECEPGSECQSDSDGAFCACDNVDDGICPSSACVDDPDCTSCEPDCSDKECGPNGCGGVCGTCGGISECSTDTGMCEVSDACGGTCTSEEFCVTEGSDNVCVPPADFDIEVTDENSLVLYEDAFNDIDPNAERSETPPYEIPAPSAGCRYDPSDNDNLYFWAKNSASSVTVWGSIEDWSHNDPVFPPPEEVYLVVEFSGISDLPEGSMSTECPDVLVGRVDEPDGWGLSLSFINCPLLDTEGAATTTGNIELNCTGKKWPF